jgi:hypothetical protein
MSVARKRKSRGRPGTKRSLTFPSVPVECATDFQSAVVTSWSLRYLGSLCDQCRQTKLSTAFCKLKSPKSDTGIFRWFNLWQAWSHWADSEW